MFGGAPGGMAAGLVTSRFRVCIDLIEPKLASLQQFLFNGAPNTQLRLWNQHHGRETILTSLSF